MEFLEEEGLEYSFKLRHLEDVIDRTKSDRNKSNLEKTFEYKCTTEEDQKLVDTLMSGGVDLADVPVIPSKTVKLYVTSGLPDFDFERNLFMEHVHPKIRQYCRDRHGFDFQAVDLRWGMESVQDLLKPTTKTSLKELKHCQEKSIGPSFMCLMGQKYRSFMPPEDIDKDEFETILVQLAGDGREDDAIMVDKAYKEDSNAAPTMYRLQKMSDSSDEALSQWKEEMHAIQKILCSGAEACFEIGTLGSDACVRFRQSQLEKEIEVGVLELNADERLENCIFYYRTMTNIDDVRKSNEQERFLDCTADDADDTEAERMLSHLRKVMTDNLSKRNVTDSEIRFPDDLLENSSYAEKLKRNLFCTIKTLIDDFVDKRNQLYDEELLHEVFQQWGIVNKSSRVYLERDELLSSVKEYLLTESDQPLVICGEQGSGKTATIAKIVHDVNVAVLNNDLNMRTAILFRFVGQTQKSQTIQQLLHSLCHQLCFVMGKYRHEIPPDYKALKLFFLDLVQRGEYGGMLIILLDSLERLSTCDNGHKLEWLPSRIAQNVKIIVTADLGDKNLVQRLQHKCEDNVLRIPPFVSLECENIMKVLMNTQKMSVTYSQWSAIREVFQSCKLPVFIKLTLDDVKHWKSYDDASINVLGKSVDETIDKVFDRIEKTHGSVVVSHLLGYMAASKNGLSESELLDLLSLDEIVLNIVFACFQPKVRRFPPAVLVQIRQELDPYLDQVESDDILVWRWKHCQFDRIASRRYLSNNEMRRYLHSNIADYYMGIWSGWIRKPYMDIQTNKETEACRLLPEQPMVFETCDVYERYNLRKMTQLPHSLLHSERYDDLRSEVFCNFSYILNRIKAKSLQQLLTDFDMFNDRECNLVAEALRMSGSAVLLDLRSLVIELTGRLLPLCGDFIFIRELVHQCDLNIQKNSPLVPNCQCFSAPGGPLQNEGDTGGNAYCPVDVGVHKSPDGILLTAKPFYSTRVRVWELSRGDPRPDMMMPVGQIHHSRDGNYLVVFQEKKVVKIFRSDCGELIGDSEYGYGAPSHVEVSNKYLSFCVEKGCGPYVIELEDCSILHKFGYHSTAVAINSSDTHLVCNSERNILLFELPVMQRLCVAETSYVPKDIIFVSNKLKCFVLTKGKTIESVTFDVIHRRPTVRKILTDLEARDFVLSNTEKYLLVQSGHCLYVINSAKDQVDRKLTDLPEGVFFDPMSTFTGVGFSADDKLIIASRSNFLAVWDASSGEPLRVLQSSTSPVRRIFTSDVVNKAVSLLEDGTFQVWNLDNIDTTILHSNTIFPSKIDKVALSPEGKRVVAFSDLTCEAKVISFSDGHVTDILQHGHDSTEFLRDVKISKNGRFVVTSSYRKQPHEDEIESFNLLNDYILWDVDSSVKRFQSSQIRYFAISPKSNLAVFIKSVDFDESEWRNNLYSIIKLNLPDGGNSHFEFPRATEFVSAPHIAIQNTIEYFVCVVQSGKQSVDQGTNEVTDWREVRLLIKNLSFTNSEVDLIRIQTLVDGVDPDTQFLDTFPTHDEKLLLLYGRDIKEFSFDCNKGFIRPAIATKGAILYDIEREECLKHIPGILRPDSCVEDLLISSKNSVFLDSQMNVFFGESYRNVNFVDTAFSPRNFRLALDGKYIVGLVENMREIIVVRAVDGVNVGHVYVHGLATCLEIGDDDRTIAVGCEDGRVMILTLILDLSDPYTDIIREFPSRNFDENENIMDRDHETLIRCDVRQMRCRTPDTPRGSIKRRLSSASGSGRRTPDHQTISTVVKLTRRNSLSLGQNRSEACCIQ